MSKHLHHELGETLVNHTQNGAGEKMMTEAAHIWSRSHTVDAGNNAHKSFSHQMQQFDKGLHAPGGPLHGKDDLHLVGFDKTGHLMIAHVPHGKSQADEMYIVDAKDGKVVGECAWKNGKPAGPITREQKRDAQHPTGMSTHVETNEPVAIGDMRRFFFRPEPGQTTRFDKIDTDGNGSLTKAEFENFLKSVPGEKRTSLNVILNNWDKIANTADHVPGVPGAERQGIYRQDLDQWLKDQQKAQLQEQKKLQLPSLQISGPDTPLDRNRDQKLTA